MIDIEYNLRLAEVMGKQRETLDIGESLPFAQLEAKLGLTDEDVGMLLVNGVWAAMDSFIKDGDSVQIYPHIEGG